MAFVTVIVVARSWFSSTPCVRESKEGRVLYGHKVVVVRARRLRRLRRNGGGGGMWCHKTTRLTCVGGGTALTSLRKGRRYAATLLCRV